MVFVDYLHFHGNLFCVIKNLKKEETWLVEFKSTTIYPLLKSQIKENGEMILQDCCLLLLDFISIKMISISKVNEAQN